MLFKEHCKDAKKSINQVFSWIMLLVFETRAGFLGAELALIFRRQLDGWIAHLQSELDALQKQVAGVLLGLCAVVFDSLFALHR